MAKRLRSQTFVREADYHIRWGRVLTVILLALVGMTLVIPGNGTTQTANVPKPQEARFRYGYAGEIPHGRPAKVEFPQSWWSGASDVMVRRAELVAVGPVKKIYSASWALVRTLCVIQDFHVPLRTDSSRLVLVAPRHDSTSMPQPGLVIRQGPCLPLLCESPLSVSEMAPVAMSLRREVVSVFCVIHDTHVFHPLGQVLIPAGRCVYIYPGRQTWNLGVPPSAGGPVA